MTRSDQARLLQRKAAQDLAVLDRLLDDPASDTRPSAITPSRRPKTD